MLTVLAPPGYTVAGRYVLEDVIGELRVSQAYLTTPSLVGRERELSAVDEAVQRLLQRSQGASLLVRGGPGSGRSRLLDASSLSAKLAGLVVTRVAAATAPHVAFGAAHELAEQLLEALPNDALRLAQADQASLRLVMPALHDRLPAAPRQEPRSDQRAAAQVALRNYLLAIANHRPLLIAVDDVEQLDDDSRALLALLAHKTRRAVPQRAG